MKSSSKILALMIAACILSFTAEAARSGRSSDQLAGDLVSAKQLPPAPEGVADLRFDEIFKMPAGPLGLEFTDKTKALEGKSVRIFGYMTRQGKPCPGVALLAAYPINTFESDYNLCDDLPGATVFVVVPKYADIAVPYTPGLLLLTGRLEITPREEADGRISHVRLILAEDEITPASPTPAVPAAQPNSP